MDCTVLSDWIKDTMSVYTHGNTHTDTTSICSVPTHDWIKVQWKIQRSVIIIINYFNGNVWVVQDIRMWAVYSEVNDIYLIFLHQRLMQKETTTSS